MIFHKSSLDLDLDICLDLSINDLNPNKSFKISKVMTYDFTFEMVSFSK